MSDKSEWEITDNESTEVKKVRCPKCGEESVVLTELAIASDKVVCDNCGNEKKLNAPSPAFALLIVFAAILYYKTIYRPKEWFKQKLDV